MDKILVVDDEPNIRASLEEILTGDGYLVTAVESGEAALEALESETFDLALLDLKLTGMGGIDVLKGLRERALDTVVIVLTAHASMETAIEALRQGAHDYLFKPCRPAELRESIQRGLVNRHENEQQDLQRQLEHMASSLEDMHATLVDQLKRPSPSAPRPTGRRRRFLQRGGLIVDHLRHAVTLDGHLLDLSPTEFEMLAYLVKEAPRIISPQELVREVQGYESEPWEASETARQHVYRIRLKTREATGRTEVIRTVRGVGYTIDDS